MFWIKEIFAGNFPLSLLMVLCSVFLLFYYYKKSTILLAFFLISFFILVLLQVKTTNFQNGYKLLPAEIDLQIKRMNLFPRKLARLAYYLEYKKEMLIFNKFLNNFFDILDFKLYFGNYFSYFSIPFFFTGLFIFFNSRKRFLQILFICTVGLLSLLGKNGIFGPILFLPFFFLFISTGILKFSKVFKK